MNNSKFEEIDLSGLKNSFVFFPAFTFGVEDSLHPTALAMTLIFALVLVLVGRNKLSLHAFGLMFIAVVCYMNYKNFMGIFDPLDRIVGFQLVVETFFMIIAFLFVHTGILCFLDWIKLKKGADILSLASSVPDLQTDNKQIGVKRNVFLVVLLWILRAIFVFTTATFVSVMGAEWHQQYYIFLDFYYSAYNQDMMGGFYSIGLYLLGLCLPMIVIWMFLACFKGSQKAVEFFQNKIGLIKLVCSAVFLSAGIGLIYTYTS